MQVTQIDPAHNGMPFADLALMSASAAYTQPSVLERAGILPMIRMRGCGRLIALRHSPAQGDRGLNLLPDMSADGVGHALSIPAAPSETADLAGHAGNRGIGRLREVRS
jgi:hypothetical protein